MLIKIKATWHAQKKNFTSEIWVAPEAVIMLVPGSSTIDETQQVVEVVEIVTSLGKSFYTALSLYDVAMVVNNEAKNEYEAELLN
jgi:hypothetical protein